MSKIHTKMVGQLQAHDRLTYQKATKSRKEWLRLHILLNNALTPEQRETLQRKLAVLPDDQDKLNLINQAIDEVLYGPVFDYDDEVCGLCGRAQCSH